MQMPQRQFLDSILVKPAGPDCNMACRYCFYLEKASLFSQSPSHRMSDEILELMIRQVMAQGRPQVSFGWQGGEPTLMGVPFFEKAVEWQQRYGRNQSVGNGLQTNGILIDDRWATFLKKYNFLVGLSLDGSEHIHNHYRFLRGGQGSWSRVVDNAKRMLDAGVEVNALTVVTDYSVQYPVEIYQFHKFLGLNFMQFIPCVETDPEAPTRAAPFSVAPAPYGKFLCTLFDLWLADFVDGRPTTSIRYFDSVFHTYVGLQAPECTLLKSCGIYVVVEHNGDVYSCDFYVEPAWKLGNIKRDNLVDMLNSPCQKAFALMKATLPATCSRCQWLRHCWGGCTKDRMRDPRDQKLNHFCLSYQMFFEHADGQLQQLAKDWKRQQTLTVLQQPSSSRAVAHHPVSRNTPCPCGSGKKYKKCCGK